MHRGVLPLGLCLFAAAPNVCRAGDEEATATAKRLFKAGSQDYGRGRYREAISEFEAAYRAKPHPSLFFNLAKSYEKLGDLPQALLDYHRYLQQLPGATDRGQVEAAIARLDAQLGERGRQALLLTSEPSGATVTVDGEERGHTPFAGELRHGAHTLGLELRGFQPVHRELLAQPGGAIQLEIPLARQGAPVPSTPPLVETPAPRTAPSAPAQAVSGAVPAAGPREVHRTWTWVAAGATGAALLAGGTLLLLAEHNRTELVDGRHSNTTTPSVQSLYDDALGQKTASSVLFGVAGAAGAATVALFFVEGRF